LTKAAFKEVAEKGTDASAAYQQIVSNSLDVAEIFFKFSTLKEHCGLEIIKWSYSDLQRIQSEILKSTLELFFDGDAESLNLSDSSTFYFLYHRNTGKIIGGTSPRTMFFSAANVKRHKGGIVEPEFIKQDGTLFIKSEQTNTEQAFGKIELSKNHIAFCDITPLSRRDIKFQDYLHSWVKENRNITGGKAFPEFQSYLASQITADKTSHFNSLLTDFKAYKKIEFLNAEGNAIYPEVLGKELYEQQFIPDDIAATSDFVVKSTVFTGYTPPLILGGMASGIENWKLDSNTIWGNHEVNPSHDRNVLPGGGRYPWLTTEDFFEESIICFPHAIQEKNFFNGNLKSGNYCYLLPLKDTCFAYFTIDELKRQISIDGGDSTVTVTLKIPVKAGEVMLRKEYKSTEVKLHKFNDYDIAVFPNVKFINEKDAYYRIGLYKPFLEKDKNEYSAEFFLGTTRVQAETLTRNEKDNQNPVCTTYALNQWGFRTIPRQKKRKC
jgi:hypothetical protein